MQSEKQLAAHTKDLNLFGCFVETMSPFPQGTKARLRISRAGAHVSALGKVADSRPNAGMGIAFITIEPSSFPVVVQSNVEPTPKPPAVLTATERRTEERFRSYVARHPEEFDRLVRASEKPAPVAVIEPETSDRAEGAVES